MSSLQIRELPLDVYGALRRAAEREHRSLSQQAIVALKKGLGMSEDPKARRQELLRNLKEDPVVQHGDDLVDPVRFIREDRAR